MSFSTANKNTTFSSSANPKTKLFVSNCNAMEIFDSLFFGIPTLCVHRDDVKSHFDWSERVSSRSLKEMGIALEVGGTDDEKEIVKKIKSLLQNKR